jgi:predicted dehydrogenase
MKLGDRGRAVRLGIIGMGLRGKEQMKVLLPMEDVEILAVCDAYQDRVEAAQKQVEDAGRPRPFGTTDWKQVLDMPEIEAIIIMTSWQTHSEIAIAAMEKGKIVGTDVGGATSVDECWQLVRTYEKTGTPLMFLENCCYNDVEMALLRMVREGVFGEIVHARGGYQHDLRDEIGNGDIIRHYRLDHFIHRNGDLYPTHDLGPIASYINLNRGNRMLSLVSMASKAVGQSLWLKEHRGDKPELQNTVFNQGDIVITMIKCQNGETIVLTHDCTLSRPYSRGGYLQGTKGVWTEEGRQIHIEHVSKPHTFESDKELLEKYEHPLWKEYREFGLRGGHGGMDYLVLRAFIDSIQQGVAFPIDVYDAASWMVITVLSEQSIAMGSMPVAIPDFTDGKWMKREKRPVDKFSLDVIAWDAFEGTEGQ